ncbi:MAG: beta-ketoacyl-ACP synthase III [Dehalococcoidales bacterium]|nr:beta-ketoacyl-ACP synthase III [Dehalococcoidales bacterium]
MRHSTIIGTGFYVPPQVVTNDDLSKLMDTSDAWIQERTGIKQRHMVEDGIGSADLAKIAAERALADAGLTAADIDLIIFATLSPDFFFPGSACILQKKMPGFGTIPALDIRQQCTGFVYAVAIADSFIRVGAYSKILVIGAEVHSVGLDYTTRGRDVAVLFGDGAGAVIMAPTENEAEGILGFALHAEGENYDKLWVPAPYGNIRGRVNQEMIERGELFPKMDGRAVFRHAVPRFCECINEVLGKTGRKIEEVDLFIPHQANDRITHAVAERMGLPNEKVVSNIARYANTTAATIPICIHESRQDGRLKKGSLLLCAAFGSGFTWASVLMRWTV